LERAVESLRAKDFSRFVENVVTAESGSARSAQAPEGPGWIATVRGALVFITLRSQTDEVVLEAPFARLPARQRLPALRLALELSNQQEATSRVSLRG